jgi:hypothetical protein
VPLSEQFRGEISGSEAVSSDDSGNTERMDVASSGIRYPESRAGSLWIQCTNTRGKLQQDVSQWSTQGQDEERGRERSTVWKKHVGPITGE